jgi:hypothetical protein
LITADFNADGKVDNLDLARWQAGYGTASGADNGDGDADGDGDVDGNDFLTWQRNVGNTAQALTAPVEESRAVPEPASFVLAALAALGYWATRRG